MAIPSRAPPRSAPHDESVYELLHDIKSQLDVEQARNKYQFQDHEERLAVHDGRLDDHQARLLAIQQGVLDADVRAARIESTATQTLTHVSAMRGTDLDLEKRLSGVESRLAMKAEEAGAEAGELAGTKAGRKVGTPAAIMAATSLVAWAVEWWLRSR